MTSIVIVGAGPQLVLAIARTFGSQGFDVALISRNRTKLDELVGTLTAEGITAAAFPADVLDRDALTQAVKDAAAQFGGIAATDAVLPAMREVGAGTLLYTTGAGSIDPVPQVGNVNAAAAALRNWALNLHREPDGTGVQAAHVGIDVSIGMSVVPGFPTAQPEEISPVYWDLHTTKRDQAELVFSR